MRLRRSPDGMRADRPGRRRAHASGRGANRRPVSEDFNAPWPVVILRRSAVLWLRLMLVGLLLVACKTTIPPPPPGEPIPEESAPGIEATPPSTPPPDADAALKRRQAAAALTERGRRLMAEGRVDPAMRLFEQALSLAPRYGPGYFYLAEAWFTKSNWSQARAFHRQAALYLEDHAAWAVRVNHQRRRIDRAAQGIP